MRGDDRPGCDDYREAASALLDGEPAGWPRADLEAHRSGCAACTAWQHDVEALTRRARVRTADGAPAGFTAGVLDRVTLPTARRARRATVLRVLLAVVGVVQAALAVPMLADDDLGMAMSEHASHESAAWNLAVAAALLLVAWRPARVGGALAAVGTFVLVLTGLSVLDVVRGGVGPERLLTHAAVVAGALLLLALHRTVRPATDGVPVDPAVADPATSDDPAVARHADDAALRRWSARLRGSGREVA